MNIQNTYQTTNKMGNWSSPSGLFFVSTNRYSLSIQQFVVISEKIGSQQSFSAASTECQLSQIDGRVCKRNWCWTIALCAVWAYTRIRLFLYSHWLYIHIILWCANFLNGTESKSLMPFFKLSEQIWFVYICAMGTLQIGVLCG